MKIIILIIMIVFKIQVLAQTNGENVDIFGSDYFNNAILLDGHIINLIILEDNTYEIELVDMRHEKLHRSFFISFGNYYKRRNIYHFKDTLYKFEFKAKLEEEELFFKNDFDLLNGMILTKAKYHNENYKRTTIWSRIEKNMILLSNFDEIFNYDVKYKFSTGIYEIKIYNRVELSLKSDSTFIFKFLDKEIIRGNWTKTNNIINLKDTKNKMQYRITVVGNNKIFLHDMPIIGYSHYHGRPRIMKLIKNKK